jgi:signal peptidase I
MPEKRKRKETLPESILGLAAVLVSGLFIITFVMQAFEIPSGSMENTLLIGDHVFVDRLTPTIKAGYLGPLLPYRQVRRDDIIVFLHPAQRGMYVVKRVIGIPGDRIHLRNGVVYRNGEALNEPYIMPRSGRHVDFRDEFPQFAPPIGPDVPPEWAMIKRDNTRGEDLVVPEDDYFGMGDNREDSLDSRYWGFIPRQNIVGRPLFIYWSFITPSDQQQRTSWGERAGFLLHIAVHFFDQTRWSRMFHRVR